LEKVSTVTEKTGCESQKLSKRRKKQAPPKGTLLPRKKGLARAATGGKKEEIGGMELGNQRSASKGNPNPTKGGWEIGNRLGFPKPRFPAEFDFLGVARVPQAGGRGQSKRRGMLKKEKNQGILRNADREKTGRTPL